MKKVIGLVAAVALCAAAIAAYSNSRQTSASSSAPVMSDEQIGIVAGDVKSEGKGCTTCPGH